jgi:iron complex outermembrane receptor protein
MIGRVGEPGLFRVRSNLGVNWQYGDFGVNYTARYYSGMKESCISLADGWCDAPNHMANGETDPLRHTGSNTFHDLQVSWKAPWDATIALGANNVFDHKVRCSTRLRTRRSPTTAASTWVASCT